MNEPQTHDSLLVADPRVIAETAWKQAVQADRKLDEIKDLIESGNYDRAIEEMSDFVGAKKPARKEDHERQQSRKAG